MMAPKFSQRTAWDTGESEWARALRERRSASLPVLDLTASNPTECGFEYDREAILSALGHPGALEYDPLPKGHLAARAAVSGYYADHDATVDPERVFLTTGTSEAYSFLFRLLCDPGDEVLIAQPSYPLFDFLAALDDIRLVPYPIFYDYGWHLDPEALRRGITSRTRAIALVHPNNPTGHYTKAGERLVLEAICAEHGLALIVDEVFLDYPLTDTPMGKSFATGEHPVLTFVLSGLSKVVALPQMKAAWIAAFGPSAELSQAIERLEVIADTFLSISTPIQLALPYWLAARQGIQQQIRWRTRANLRTLDDLLPRGGVISPLQIEAGWYSILKVPAGRPSHETALKLLLARGISLHSGEFFGFKPSGWLVASLLPETSRFANGISGLSDNLQQTIEG